MIISNYCSLCWPVEEDLRVFGDVNSSVNCAAEFLLFFGFKFGYFCLYLVAAAGRIEPSSEGDTGRQQV
ncbi:hypothetical protein RchiOBHm_Chr3g0495461 [Rosa chinensis]|uniref:Uncharacterized protein n=1 Tax=Rosa chinensis TaxID=74649 RepID=A0A2P6RH86_ROSCH|nr:hypothetical protein RchiOBHm_Chr3g0495461 [Rosa chinensis]